MRNKDNCFLSFCSWDNQVFKSHDVIKAWKHEAWKPKHETENTFYWITWKQTKPGNEIWPVYVILQKKFFYQKTSMKNGVWKLGSF